MTKPLIPRQIFFHEFEPLVGQTFVADCNPRPAELKLERAVPIRMTGAIVRPQFTLIFSSSPSVFLVASTYTLRCGQFGPEMIDLAPIIAPAENGAGRHYYQATFS